LVRRRLSHGGCIERNALEAVPTKANGPRKCAPKDKPPRDVPVKGMKASPQRCLNDNSRPGSWVLRFRRDDTVKATR
jgi:hypothetical protein